jgi:hypothetical protein
MGRGFGSKTNRMVNRRIGRGKKGLQQGSWEPFGLEDESEIIAHKGLIYHLYKTNGIITKVLAPAPTPPHFTGPGQAAEWVDIDVKIKNDIVRDYYTRKK